MSHYRLVVDSTGTVEVALQELVEISEMMTAVKVMAYIVMAHAVMA